MTTQAVILGTQCRIFLEGGTIVTPAGTASADTKPGASEAAWISVPCIGKGELKIENELREIMCPSSGPYVRGDALLTGQKATITITLNKISTLIYQLLFGYNTVDGSTVTVIQPFAGKGTKGWVELKIYDHTNTVWTTLTLWCLLRPTGTVTFDDNITTPTIDLVVIDNSLNTSDPA